MAAAAAVDDADEPMVPAGGGAPARAPLHSRLPQPLLLLLVLLLLLLMLAAQAEMGEAVLCDRARLVIKKSARALSVVRPSFKAPAPALVHALPGSEFGGL